MTDTRALLNRIAQFRQRLEALPRLVPGDDPAPAKAAGPGSAATEATPRSRTEATVQDSLRRLHGGQAPPAALTNRARRLLADAQGLVTRLRATADDPLLAGPPAPAGVADPLAVHYRETAALTEAAVRYVSTFPASADDQGRLCEGLEVMIDAARRRFDLLAGVLERRRTEAERIDALARFLCCVHTGDGPVDPAPVVGLADAILAEEPGRPLRFLVADPTSTQGHLGGPECPAPARFVAAHSLNCAQVLARIVRNDGECRDQARDLVLAALLHDVGMLGVEVGLLADPGRVDGDRRRMTETHARAGADRIAVRLPGLSGLAEAAAAHHERADGTGYPGGLTGDRVSPMTRLIAAVDVYAALCAPRPHRPELDPRAALTDVLLMADRGRLDRYAAEKLLGLGLYPAGAVVELSDGWTAVVVAARDPRSAMRAGAQPVVALLADPDARPLATPRFVDLADAGGSTVVRTLAPADRLRRLGRSYPECV